MRWVLPGGAELDGSNRQDDERRVACRPGAAVLVRTKRGLSVSRAELAEALSRVEDTVRTLQQEHQELCARIEQLRSNTNGFEDDELNADALPWHRLTRHMSEVKAAIEQLRVVIVPATSAPP